MVWFCLLTDLTTPDVLHNVGFHLRPSKETTDAAPGHWKSGVPAHGCVMECRDHLLMHRRATSQPHTTSEFEDAMLQVNRPFGSGLMASHSNSFWARGFEL